MDLTSLNKDRKKRNHSVDLPNMVYGKVPPQAKEIEETILGALMVEPSAFNIVDGIIRAEMFYVEANQNIYSAIKGLQSKGKPFDILTVVEELKMREQLDAVGGPFYVTKLTNGVVTATPQHLETWCGIILDKWTSRELIKISGEIIGMAYEDSDKPQETLTEASSRLNDLANGITRARIITMSDNCKSWASEMDRRISQSDKGLLPGITSGFEAIDNITLGWQPGDFISFYAMQSVGKTALCLNMVVNAAKAGYPSAFGSREMRVTALMDRIVAAEAAIKMRDLRSGKIEPTEYRKILNETFRQIEKLPLYLYNAAGDTWQDTRQKYRNLKNKAGLVLGVDDYFQLGKDSDSRGKSREQYLSTISGETKQTALMLDLAIIMPSQVAAKEISKSKEKWVPRLNDGRETDALANDCDIIGTIYRPEYQGTLVDEEGNKTTGETIIQFVKNRQGGRNDKVYLHGDLSIQKFYSKNDVKAIPFDLEKKNEEFDEGFNETENLRFK